MDIAYRPLNGLDAPSAARLAREYLGGPGPLAEAGVVYWIAADGPEVVGVAFGDRREGSDTLTLKGIAVNLDHAKPYARQGIGSRLLAAVEQEARRRGCRAVGVGSADDPRVEQFYRKNGYHPVEMVAKTREGQELARLPIVSGEPWDDTREALRAGPGVDEVILIFCKSLMSGSDAGRADPLPS